MANALALFLLLVSSFTVFAQDLDQVLIPAITPSLGALPHTPLHPPVAAPPHSPTPTHSPLHPPTHPPAHPPHHHNHHHSPAPAPAPIKPPVHPRTPIHPPVAAPPHHHHHTLPPSPSTPTPTHSPIHPPTHPPAHPPHHHNHHHHHSPAPAPIKPPVHLRTPTPTPAPPSHHLYPPTSPPAKPPTHHHYPPPPTPAPAHPPVHPFPRSFVAVQGVVFTKSCKYAGVDTLLGATPLLGAVVKLECNNTRYPLVQKVKTDKNGYFYVQAPKTITTFGAHKCKVFLVSALTGLKPSNLHGGVTGSSLRPEKPFMYQKLPFLLYNVGPLAFEPKCPH